MKTYYSKSIGAVVGRQSDFLSKNSEMVEKSLDATKALLDAPLRTRCTLCAAPPPEATFEHRGAPYFECRTCGQIQSLNDSTMVEWDPEKYAQVYPELSPEMRQERVEGVYAPKLDWIVEAAKSELGLGARDLLSKRWLEIGCGEGLFLEALRAKGGELFTGVDVDEHMIQRCCKLFGDNCVEKSCSSIQDVVSTKDFDVLVAWYVMEHIFELDLLADSLAELEAGTLFCFAVPTHSFSSVFESTVASHYPRTLDNSVHTQLFTDKSIDYLLERAGFDKAAQWVFGQDAADLGRVLSLGLAQHYPDATAEKFGRQFSAAIDDMQKALDKQFLSDSRHVLAIKK